MVKVLTFTAKGTKTKETTLPREFDVKPNLNLLAQAVHVYEERSHVGLRKAKTRSEVNRTTKKLYKQKGTGGARHGSRRANLFVGGGVALGPRPIRRILTLPDKLKVSAKAIVYSLKADQKELVVVSGLSKIGKTSEAAELVKALTKVTAAKRFTFILSIEAKEIVKFFRNLANASAIFYRDANAFDIYKGGMIVLDRDVFSLKKTDVKEKSKSVNKTTKKVVKSTK